MKSKIFNNSTEGATAISEVEDALGIPQQGTGKYANVWEIINPESPYVGKFTFPIMTEGAWKCDKLFDPDELVAWDDSWFETPVPE